jgi:predicted lipid-binding transport protein (Tim44 family)
MATEAAASKKADKAKKGSKQDAKKAAKGAATDPSGGPSVAAHPRAARAVARAKGWGALAGFVLGGYLSLSTNTLAMAGLRALAAGLICYVAVWAGAVFVWRRLVMLEIKGRQQKLLSARQSEGR